jgi:hypothetical protein
VRCEQRAMSGAYLLTVHNSPLKQCTLLTTHCNLAFHAFALTATDASAR